MNRRRLILGVIAAALSVARGWAEERLRVVAFPYPGTPNDARGLDDIETFQTTLPNLGWLEGQDLQLDVSLAV